MNYYVRNKWMYSLIVLVLLAIIIWIIAGTSSSDNGNEVQVNQETYTMTTSVEENTESQTVSKGYYLVQNEDGIVRVYWISENEKHLHLETAIPYTLLNEEDQKILDEGMKLETDDELASFLENYDS